MKASEISELNHAFTYFDQKSRVVFIKTGRKLELTIAQISKEALEIMAETVPGNYRSQASTFKDWRFDEIASELATKAATVYFETLGIEQEIHIALDNLVKNDEQIQAWIEKFSMFKSKVDARHEDAKQTLAAYANDLAPKLVPIVVEKLKPIYAENQNSWLKNLAQIFTFPKS